MSAENATEVRSWAKSYSGIEPCERAHRDRPEWAYDEDGNCVACGNGRWKFHALWCEIAYLIEHAIDAGDSLYVRDST